MADLAGDECREFKVRRIGALAHRCPLNDVADPNAGAANDPCNAGTPVVSEQRPPCAVFLPSVTRAATSMQRFAPVLRFSRLRRVQRDPSRSRPAHSRASESGYERSMKLEDYRGLVEELLPAVLAAGRIEMRHFRSGVEVSTKADTTPVTVADHEAEEVLTEALHRAMPGVPVIAEEAVAAVHLRFMAAFADSHIQRKYGAATAEAVRGEADLLDRHWLWRGPWVERRRRLLAFDSKLKSRNLNPGTSADLTVACLLAHRLDDMIRLPPRSGPERARVRG